MKNNATDQKRRGSISEKWDGGFMYVNDYHKWQLVA